MRSFPPNPDTSCDIPLLGYHRNTRYMFNIRLKKVMTSYGIGSVEKMHLSSLLEIPRECPLMF
jgi:hypothetical protein